MKKKSILGDIHSSLLIEQKSNPAFALISDISYLEKLTPLSTQEMHAQSAKLIASAEQEILIQFYKYDLDCDGAKIINAALCELQKKAQLAKKKITVNIILNARGQLAQLIYKKQGKNSFQDLPKELNADFFQINLRLHETNSFDSFHSKFIVVDGRQAMLRGGDPMDLNDFSRRRYESALIGDAPLAQALRLEFLSLWEEDFTQPLHAKPKDSQPLQLNQSMDEKIPFIFISKHESANPFETDCGPYKVALLKAIKNSVKTIRISTSNLNDPHIIAALAHACHRGIKIYIVLGKHDNDESEKKWGGTNLSSMALLTSKVSRLHLPNLFIRWASNKSGKHSLKELHTKYVCIDDSLVFTGSSPLDKQAMYHSREADMIFESKTKATEFTDKFFTPLFRSGIEYFEDAYKELRQTIQELILPLKSMENFNVRKWAKKLEKLLLEQETVISSSDKYPFEKMLALLKALHPLIHQGKKVAFCETNPYIKVIQSIAKKYGVEAYLAEQPPAPIEMTLVSCWNSRQRPSPTDIEDAKAQAHCGPS